MMKIILSKSSEVFLSRVPEKHLQQILMRMEDLAKNPPPLDQVALKGNLRNYGRISSGEYRIIFMIEDNNLKIVLVGKRNDAEIYKILKRK